MLKNPFSIVRRYRITAEKAGCFEEIFVEQPYYWLAQQATPNTTLIDIGAKIGETAIYFAMFPNIKKVIAFEPMPFSYNMMRENITKNPLREKIEIQNMAISDTEKQRRIDKDRIMNGKYSFSYAKNDGGGASN